MKTAGTCGAEVLVGSVALVAMTFGGIAPDVAHAQTDSANISGNIGLNFSNAYFYRGIRQERKGLINQPYADLTWGLFAEPDADGLHTVDLALGIWNSLHTGPTGSEFGSSATHVRSWYESDFFTAMTLGLDNWDVGITYTAYMSPNNAFSSISELSFNLAMDDSELIGVFAMNPHVVLAVELDGQADGGTREGVYFEIGVDPGMEFRDGGASVSFPITFGSSLSNYYENGEPLVGPSFSNTFGFFSVGASFSYPIPNTPEGYGNWALSGKFHLLTLGEYLRHLNESDGVQPVGVFGVNIGF